MSLSQGHVLSLQRVSWRGEAETLLSLIPPVTPHIAASESHDLSIKSEQKQDWASGYVNLDREARAQLMDASPPAQLEMWRPPREALTSRVGDKFSG